MITVLRDDPFFPGDWEQQRQGSAFARPGTERRAPGTRSGTIALPDRRDDIARPSSGSSKQHS